jgi:hypothetical protein
MGNRRYINALLKYLTKVKELERLFNEKVVYFSQNKNVVAFK